MVVVVCLLVGVLVGLFVGPPLHRVKRPRPRGAFVALLFVLASAWPIVRELPRIAGTGAFLWADASSHAAIAKALNLETWMHGWIDTYNGGFPIGPHYPVVGWALASACIKLGVRTEVALMGLGTLATYVTPVATFALAVRRGAHPALAAIGGVVLCTLRPYVAYVGGWATFLHFGLLSQVLALPLVVTWLFAVTSTKRAWFCPVVGALLVLTHPQIGISAILLSTPLAVFVPRIRCPFVTGAVGAILLAVAVYLPGIVTNNVPFGWPAMADWKVFGFPPARLEPWLVDGELLDNGRWPIVTFLWIFFCGVLASGGRRAVGLRWAVVVASLGALLLSVSGYALRSAGVLGGLALTFAQPMRVLACIPIAVVAAMVIGATRLYESRVRWMRRGRGWLSWTALTALTAGLTVNAASPFVHEHLALDDRYRHRAHALGIDALRDAVAKARGGRLAFDDTGALEQVPVVSGVHLSANVPLAGTGGAGAHVGVLALAFEALKPQKEFASNRAEALGVRWLVHARSETPEPPSDWELIAETAEASLSRRRGGTDMIGLACPIALWKGSNRLLHQWLNDDLSGSASTLHDPTAVTLLVQDRASGQYPLDLMTTCDAGLASIRNNDSNKWSHAATVDSSRGVFAVLRVSAHPWWVATVDGSFVEFMRVAPGFMAVHVPEGEHHVRFEVRMPWLYPASVASAWLTVGWLVWWGRRRAKHQAA